MQEILNWTIDTIRQEEKIDFTWLEEQKFEWTPLVIKTLKSLVNDNYSILILSDDDRYWFTNYILSNINDRKNNRPNLPFYDFRSLYGKYNKINSEEDIKLINDMLNISFPNGYVFWYIGKGNSKEFMLPRYHDNSFLWLIDETLPKSLIFSENDSLLDIKLLQMYKLFSQTLNAILFAEVIVD
jgi:hypothetical protein